MGASVAGWLAQNGLVVPYRECKCETARDAADRAKAAGGRWTGSFQLPWETQANWGMCTRYLAGGYEGEFSASLQVRTTDGLHAAEFPLNPDQTCDRTVAANALRAIAASIAGLPRLRSEQRGRQLSVCPSRYLRNRAGTPSPPACFPTDAIQQIRRGPARLQAAPNIQMGVAVWVATRGG
jgi:hypothetical protein